MRSERGSRLRRSACTLLWAAIAASCSSRAADVPARPSGDREPPPQRPPDVERAPLPSIEPAAADESVPLPEIPLSTGPPEIRVQYPPSRGRIAVRDSNFIFGTVMTGEAELVIDGHPVPIEPNGAFLAWLPVPEASEDGEAEYVLVARGPAGGETLRHPIRVPPEPFEGEPGGVWIDPESLPADVDLWLMPADPLPFSVRAAPGLAVAVQARDVVARLREVKPGLYEGSLPMAAILEERCAERGPRAGPCSGPSSVRELAVRVSATDGRRSTSETRRYPIAGLDPAELPVVELSDAPDPVHGKTDVVVGRPTPYGAYRWLFPERSRGLVDRKVGDRVRLRLSSSLGVWLAEEDIELTQQRGDWTARVERVHVESRPGGSTFVVVPLDRAVPAHVEELDGRALKLVLHGALAGTDRMVSGTLTEPAGGALEGVSWQEKPDGAYEIVVRTGRGVWGHRLSYATVGEGRAELVLVVRSPPVVDPASPLRGRRIAVDAGHPPVGAFGPTGLYEGDVNLAIARRLARQLEERGAEPILIRRDTLPLGLYERTASAVSEDADLFISIHNNALPDGVRPFGEEGTSTYYYHPHSRQLAESVQAGLISTLGLRDLGSQWGNFVVVRMPWMPSVLTEGAFMMFPRHEAALRTAVFQEAYARGVLKGIEDFLIRFASPEREKLE